MKPYQLFVSGEVMGQLIQMPRSRRLKLLEFFNQVKSNPFIKGDFQQKDAYDRDAEVKALGQYLITYYADHAVREVHILSLELD